jgi:hypothetical protein
MPSETSIDEAVGEWRQGDCVLGEHSFIYRTQLATPLTAPSPSRAAEGVDIAESEVLGFMVVTQTCDVARSCSDRPYVEVCPLVEVDPPFRRDIAAGRRPRYAFIPALAARGLVADLDRVMTVRFGSVPSHRGMQLR